MTLANPGHVQMFNYGQMPGPLPKRPDLVTGIYQCHLSTVAAVDIREGNFLIASISMMFSVDLGLL